MKGLCSGWLLSDLLVYPSLIKSLWKQHEEQILKSLPAVPSGLTADGFDIIAPDDLLFVIDAHFPAVGGGGVEQNGLCQLFGKTVTVDDGDHF